MKKEQNNHDTKLFWFPLDNLAKIFPSNSSSRLTTLFRITAIMKFPIKISLLQKSFEIMVKRCPYFKVQLKSGFFWYYIQSNPSSVKVMADSKYPCMKMPFKKEGVLLLRVRAFKNRISVEFSHILTDGTGGLNFLKALVVQYLKLSGTELDIDNDDTILKITTSANKKEWEDSFKRVYKKDIPLPNKFNKAYHIPFNYIDKNKYYITTGILSAKLIIKKAGEKNVSLTEFLTALYFDALQDLYFMDTVKKSNRNPIRISIPVNLRKMYASTTMRNFFLTVSPEIDPRLGRYTFDEILKKVYHFMRTEIDEKYINQQIKRNVGGEIHPVIRALPLFIKNLGLLVIYNFFGDNQYTTNFSNLGRVEMPDEGEKYIEGFDFYPPPNPQYKISATAISYKDRLSITFGRIIEESHIERLFFTKLTAMGIPVKIISNKE